MPRDLQIACRAGFADPFCKAEVLLRELASRFVDVDTLLRHCHNQAPRAAASRVERIILLEAFDQAPGGWELHVDASKVNIVEDHWTPGESGRVCPLGWGN